jgi:hypothetical protein
MIFFKSNLFFSETTSPNVVELVTNDVCKVFYKEIAFLHDQAKIVFKYQRFPNMPVRWTNPVKINWSRKTLVSTVLTGNIGPFQRFQYFPKA